jgi:hypothetical protein
VNQLWSCLKNDVEVEKPDITQLRIGIVWPLR